MGKIQKYLVLLITLFLISSCGFTLEETKNPNSNLSTGEWLEISDNLSYSILHTDKKDLLIVKIDPKKYTFSIHENKDQEKARTIEEIHSKTKSLLTFNGGFFTEDFKPTGLLISDRKEFRSLSNAQLLNGIIAIKGSGEIDFFYKQNTGKFPITITPSNYTFAIQNGPALINQEGEVLITEDTEEKSSRTALGVDKDGNIVLIILKQSLLNADNAISLYNFAHLIKNSPELSDMGLHSLLNLDGGSSTGLMIDDKYFPEMEKVQNVVIVKPI
jgi:uncharacterized protein YigE (DUF2233 family)